MRPDYKEAATPVDDLIAAAYEDGDKGLEDHSDRLSRLRSRLIERIVQMERRVADAERGQQGEAEPVRGLQGAEGPPGAVGGEDLHDLRRVAADPGSPKRPASPGRVNEAAQRVYVAALGRAYSEEAHGGRLTASDSFSLDHAQDEWHDALDAYVRATSATA